MTTLWNATLKLYGFFDSTGIQFDEIVAYNEIEAMSNMVQATGWQSWDEFSEVNGGVRVEVLDYDYKEN